MRYLLILMLLASPAMAGDNNLKLRCHIGKPCHMRISDADRKIFRDGWEWQKRKGEKRLAMKGAK